MRYYLMRNEVDVLTLPGFFKYFKDVQMDEMVIKYTVGSNPAGIDFLAENGYYGKQRKVI